MAQEWTYKFMGEIVGPLSTSEFREHVADGRVQPDSLVTRDGTDEWVSADRIKGLFDSEGGLLLKTEDTDEDGYEEATVVYENSTIYEEPTNFADSLPEVGQSLHTKDIPSSWIVISTVVLGSVGMFWFCMGGGSEDEKIEDKRVEESRAVLTEFPVQTEDGMEIEAWVISQDFITNRLKSPGTASYGGMFEQVARNQVKYGGQGKYRVQGWVDSQNSYGAVVRTNFSLVLKYTPATKEWSLIGQPIMIQR